MNRFVGNPFVWACCAAMMLWTHLSWAELSATADRRTIAMGETLRLTLLGDAGEQPAEIDLTPLNRDWEILSRSSATNARFINGQNQVTRTLEMELAPLREGTLTIPSLTAGGRSTTPLAIRVNPEPVVAPGDELVLFDASVDASSVYVQSEVILTVTLQQAINLDGGEISNFDIPDAVVENLERRSFQRRVGNRTWLVTELRYAVYPQKSGALRIPAIGFTAREVQPGRSLLGARLGRRLRMASEPLEIDVKSVPTSFPGEVWLPARALTLEENWSIDPASLNVGDSTTRTLTLTARGLQGSQLPPLSSVQGAINIPELRFYPDQESIDQSELAEGLQGRRVQSEALVARSGGTWTLPEIRVPWWNIETDRLEFATLPARTVVVTAIQSADQTNDPTIAPSASPGGHYPPALAVGRQRDRLVGVARARHAALVESPQGHWPLANTRRRHGQVRLSPTSAGRNQKGRRTGGRCATQKGDSAVGRPPSRPGVFVTGSTRSRQHRISRHASPRGGPVVVWRWRIDVSAGRIDRCAARGARASGSRYGRQYVVALSFVGRPYRDTHKRPLPEHFLRALTMGPKARINA